MDDWTQSDQSTAPTEPRFRSSKRHKVFRKRQTVQDERDKGVCAGRFGRRDLSLPVEDAEDEEDDDDDDEHKEEDDEHDENNGQNSLGRPPVVTRPPIKKLGISFSSARRPAVGSSEASTASTALVPLQDQTTKKIPQVDRFVKPTGKIDVVEDIHLTAYVDSRLAELRSSSALSQHENASVQTSGAASPSHSLPMSADDSSARDTAYQATERATMSSGKGFPYGSRPPTQQRKYRRQPPARDETSVVRGSIVDQIMAESQVPMYDRTISLTPSVRASAAAKAANEDADEAVAVAFKAEFLANLQQRRRRLHASAIANPKKVQHVSHGPKLGGSRSQRGKMRALQQAKNASEKK